MGTILTYLRDYGDYTFDEKAFSEVDSLALSQLAYLKFDGIVPGPEAAGETVSIKDVASHADYEHLYADERYRQDNTALFAAFLESRRFANLKFSNYVNLIELEKESQFSAITYQMEDIYYVAFRGTDETLVGWKEDLNLGFSEPVPGQLMSVGYLERAAGIIPGDFYVGGHSKGGNLAVYSSMNCKKEVRRRIALIFDHDGPGFRPEVRKEGAYEEIADRVRKTIPHSSLVGMLFSAEEGCQVVESKSVGVAQHNPYSWIVKGDSFKYVGQVYASRRFIDDTLNEWILSLSQEEMHTFVDTLYKVVLASDTDNLIDFTANWFKSVQKIGTALKDVDEESRQVIIQIIRALFDMISINAKEMLKNKKLPEKEKFEEGLARLEGKTWNGRTKKRSRNGQKRATRAPETKSRKGARHRVPPACVPDATGRP